MDLLAQLNEANVKITSLTGERDKLQSDLQAASAKVKPLETSIATLTSERDGARADLTISQNALKDEQTTNATAIAAKDLEITNLKGEVGALKTSAKTAEQLATERSGKGGNKGVAGGGGNKSGGLTSAEALAEYAAIKDSKERAEYYAEHKAVMFPPKK